MRGGFPEAVIRDDPSRRARLLAGYVRNLIDRDIREIGDIGKADELQRLLQLVAARTGQLLVTQQLAVELKLDSRTVLRYLELCEEVVLIKRIPARSSNLGKRVVSTPKVACVDSGIAAYLLGQSVGRLRRLTNTSFGPMLEGFVAM